MATNSPETYGRDVACISDADELWTEAVGVDVIMQDTIHVLTCDDFLGPKGNKRGMDVRKLIGKRQDELNELSPMLTSVVMLDERIDTCDIVLTATKNGAGMMDVELSVTCTTALGPFSFVKLVSELTAADFGGLN